MIRIAGRARSASGRSTSLGISSLPSAGRPKPALPCPTIAFCTREARSWAYWNIEELVGVTAVRVALLILLLCGAAMADDDRTAERQQIVDYIVALSHLVAGESGEG